MNLTEILLAILIVGLAAGFTIWALGRNAERQVEAERSARFEALLGHLTGAIKMNADATQAAANGSSGVSTELKELRATMWGVAASAKEANEIRVKDTSERLALVADIRAGKVPHPSPSRPRGSEPRLVSGSGSSVPPAPLSEPDRDETTVLDRKFFGPTTTLLSETEVVGATTLRGTKAVSR